MRFGPDEGLGLGIVMGDIRVDRGDEFGHAGEHAAAQASGSDVAEESLDDVQPRC